MDEQLSRICHNCEFSKNLSSLPEDYCICFRREKRTVRRDGQCRYFTPDLLRFVPSSKRIRTIDAPDITGI